MTVEQLEKMSEADKESLLEDLVSVSNEMMSALAAHKAQVQKGIATKKADEKLWQLLEEFSWVLE